MWRSLNAIKMLNSFYKRVHFTRFVADNCRYYFIAAVKSELLSLLINYCICCRGIVRIYMDLTNAGRVSIGLFCFSKQMGSEQCGFVVVFVGPGGFKKFLEACRNNFH